MRYIWNFVNSRSFSARGKYYYFLLILSIISGIIGFAVWGILQFRVLKGAEWAFVFTGYPIVLSWLIGFVYTARHEF